MLDRDLAMLYGVETRALKQAEKRTMRQYSTDDVARPLIDQFLADAAHAPTGGNTCDLTFTVVDTRSALRRLLEELMSGLERSVAEKPELPEFIRAAMTAYRQSHADEVFRGAPHLLIASAGEKPIAEMRMS
jgi:nitroreductase